METFKFKLIIFYIILLSSCGKPVEYFMYIQSYDTINPVEISAKGNFNQYDKIDKMSVNTPKLLEIYGLTANGKTKSVNYEICRLNNDSIIKGYIGPNFKININNQEYSFIEIIQNTNIIISNDSLMNVLKETNKKGYFEIQPNETCKEDKINIGN